jgi:hypothetical protein
LGVPVRGSRWCPAHHPDYQERRRRGAKKGGKSTGRSRQSERLEAVDKTLTEMISGVLDGSVDRGNAAVVIQAANARIRLATAEMQVREQEVVEERLDELEARLARVKGEDDHAGGGRWRG